MHSLRPLLAAWLLATSLSAPVATATPIFTRTLDAFKMVTEGQRFTLEANGRNASFGMFGELMAAGDVRMRVFADGVQKFDVLCKDFSFDLKDQFAICEVGGGKGTVSLDLPHSELQFYR